MRIFLQRILNPELWIDFVFKKDIEAYERHFHPLIPKRFDAENEYN